MHAVVHNWFKLFDNIIHASTILYYHSNLQKSTINFLKSSQFQLLGDNDIPQEIRDKATVTESEDHRYFRMDILWNYLSTLRTPDHALHFSRLRKVAKLVLVIPHSNAEEEWIFSIVWKNKTAFHPSLNPKETLSSILTIMLANPEPAHCFQPTKELLKTAKSATWEYNKAHVKKWKCGMYRLNNSEVIVMINH